ncbi:Uncharacterised protein [Serratia liquefaciens]|nr:Uncharacterised protein [Serratia liquefaciens]
MRAAWCPPALTEPLTPFLRCMSGTNQRQSRCAALSGDIGDAVHLHYL